MKQHSLQIILAPQVKMIFEHILVSADKWGGHFVSTYLPILYSGGVDIAAQTLLITLMGGIARKLHLSNFSHSFRQHLPGKLVRRFHYKAQISAL